MSQSFHYKSLSPGGFDVDLGTQAARLGDFGGYSMRAEVADVGTSTFIIDDPLGTVGNASDDILGLQGFYVTESDCAAVGADGVNGQRLFTGYTRERTYRRGTGSRTSLRTGVAREIEVALTDLNFYASWRINRDSRTVLTGTVTKTSGNTTVSGSGTAFLTQLDVGSTISVPGGGGTDVLYVASVGSNTSLVVVTAPTNSASGQVLTRLDGARPAETDLQRVGWLISGQANSLPPFFYVTNDAGWIDTSGPVNMDAVDYTGQTAADVLNDCAIASGRNYWIGYWEATGNNSLWYANPDTSTTYTSLLSISDVLTDVDQVTTFAPEPDAALRRDPVRVYAGVYLPFESGTSYQTNTTTGSNYGWRDASAPTANIKTQAKADAAALRMVNDFGTEEDRITCKVRLPSTLATGIKVGQRIQGKFSQFPGYDIFRWLRVASLGVTQDEATDKRYTLDLELTPQRLSQAQHLLIGVLLANGFSGTFDDYSENAWTQGPFIANFASPVQSIACGAGPPTYQAAAIWYRPVVPGESKHFILDFLAASSSTGGWVFEVAGYDSSRPITTLSSMQTAAEGATVALSSSTADATLFGLISYAKVSYDGGWGWPGGGYGYNVVTAAAGTQVVNASAADDAFGTPPWAWIAYDSDASSQSIACIEDTHGAGGGYACGCMVGKFGIVIPTTGTFSVIQSGFATGGLGTHDSVSLPNDPTPS